MSSDDRHAAVDRKTLDVLLRQARSQNGWLDRPVTDEQLQATYALAKWGPTSMNSQPMRVIFLRSEAAKERLKPALAPGNVVKTLSAPVVAILAYDTRFYDHLSRTFPHRPDAKDHFIGDARVSHAETTAFRNATLQAAYFILASRAIGLDCGPMSGFDNAKVDAEFFAGTSMRSNFLCGIGYGDDSKIHARLPRLTFEDVCAVY